MEEEIKKNSFKEVKEVIFNEEFRAILRRNLFSRMAEILVPK